MRKMGWEKWGICPKVPIFPISLPFPANFTHFFYISWNALLAISHDSPFPPFPPFPPISPHFPIFPIVPSPCGSLANSAAANAEACVGQQADEMVRTEPSWYSSPVLAAVTDHGLKGAGVPPWSHLNPFVPGHKPECVLVPPAARMHAGGGVSVEAGARVSQGALAKSPGSVVVLVHGAGRMPLLWDHQCLLCHRLSVHGQAR